MTAALVGTMSLLLPIVMPVLLCIGLGYVWGRLRKPFADDFVTTLSTTIAAPCLVFGALAVPPAGGDADSVTAAALGLMALAAVVAYGLFAAIGWLVLWPTGWSARTYLPALMFGNIGNMGLPLCLFAFGEAGLALALAFFTTGATIMFVACPWMASGRTSPAILGRTPLLYAVPLALAFRALEVPPPLFVTNTTDLLGGMMIPLMLLALGNSLSGLRIASVGRSVLLSTLRLAMGLFVGVLVAELLALEGVMRGVLILQCALPVAVFAYLFAARYDREPGEVASVVVISTLMSLLTLPFLVLLVLGG